MALWLAMWLCVMWLCSYEAMWLRGYVAMQLVVMWLCGGAVAVWWLYGYMAILIFVLIPR